MGRHTGRRLIGDLALGLTLGVFGGALTFGCTLDPQNLPELTFAVDVDESWVDGSIRPVPALPGEVRILVTNNLDDTVSVVSWDRLKAGGAGAELARFPVGIVPLEREGPHHLSVSDDGRFAYVGISNFVPGAGSGPHGIHGSGTAEGRALMVDLDTQVTVRAERVDRNPGDVRLTPDGRYLLMSHFDLVAVNEAAAAGVFSGPDVDARLAILDSQTLKRLPFVDLCPAPHGIAISPDSTTVVASCLSDEAAIVDLVAWAAGETDIVTLVPMLENPGTAAAPQCSPYASTMSGDGSMAWISCYSSGELVGVDLTTRQRTVTLTLPGLAVFGDFADGGNRFAVATQDTDGVAFLVDNGDGTAGLERFVPLASEGCVLPHTVHFMDDDTRLAVVCEGNKRDPGTLMVLDASTGARLGSVSLGRFPDDIAVQVKP